MHDHIPIRQFRASLSEVLRRVQQREERIAITRHGKVLGVLVPVTAAEAVAQSELERDRTDSLNAIFAYLVNEDRAPHDAHDTDDATPYAIAMTRTAVKQARALSPLRRRLLQDILATDWRERTEPVSADVVRIRCGQARALIFETAKLDPVVLCIGG